MVFKSTTGTGLARGLAEAAAWGYPGPEGLFAPYGEGDLRSAVYAPESSFTETAASLLSNLFTEDLDPITANLLAERAFSEKPAIFNADEEIPLVDFAGGATGSSADYGAALLAALMELRAGRGRPLILVAPSGAWGAALAEAASDLESLRVVLLCGEDAVRGIKPQRLAREGGRVLLVGLRCPVSQRPAFLRSLSGKRVADCELVVAGPGNPVELATRIVLQAATFSDLHRGSSGELFAALCAGSSLALAAGLWAWRLGLPLTGLLVAEPENPRGGAPAGRPGDEEAAYAELVERFRSERAGLIGSILAHQQVGEDEALAARDRCIAAGGPWLDRSSALALAAARRSLVPALRGHSRIIVARHAHPFWESSPGWICPERPPQLAAALEEARLDADIVPELAALERMVATVL